MTTTLGTVNVAELQAISQHMGSARLPYPFTPRTPSKYLYEHDLVAFRRDVLQRLDDGAFDHLRQWIDVQMCDADLRIECVFVRDTTPTLQNVCATRKRETGFIAVQDSEDVITVSELSAYELGSALAAMANMAEKPGRHERVTIPELNIRGRPRPPARAGVILDQVSADVDTTVEIAPDQLVAGAEIQSTFGRRNRWGRDIDKDFVGWIATTTGDYVVQSPFEFAVPVTRKQLGQRIDRMIAADVARIRALRADRS